MIKRSIEKCLSLFGLHETTKLLTDIRALKFHQILRNRIDDHPNPFLRFGQKCFSQADEDGITLEIVRRLGINNGRFAEFGVGDGTENNTLVLASLGWSGFWIGGQNIAIDLSSCERLKYFKAWVLRDNIVELFARGTSSIGSNVELISLDLDGNDFYLCEKLLSHNIRPAVFIVEYNAKFPPPICFCIKYDDQHTWKMDDHYGASLTTMTALFEKYGYKLICCNATGANAFFVRNTDFKLFPEVPDSLSKIYSPPLYLDYRQFGHRISVRTIERLLTVERTTGS